MEKALQNYIEELKADVASLVYSDGEGASFEDKFTEYCIEVLDSIGKSEGARVLSYVHPNSQGGIDWFVLIFGGERRQILSKKKAGVRSPKTLKEQAIADVEIEEDSELDFNSEEEDFNVE